MRQFYSNDKGSATSLQAKKCTIPHHIKSKQRVADHGEVFTPPWPVEAMLDLVKDETKRIDARFLVWWTPKAGPTVQLVIAGALSVLRQHRSLRWLTM